MYAVRVGVVLCGVSAFPTPAVANIILLTGTLVIPKPVLLGCLRNRQHVVL